MDGLWIELARAFCLLMVIEGAIPFLWPHRWRNLLESISGTEDRVLRAVGLVSMLIGVFVLYLL